MCNKFLRQAESTRMLIPQYTIRWLLAVMAACAVVFSIFALAVRGSPWARGVSVAILSLVVVLLIHAFVFAVLWVFSVVTSQILRRWAGFGRTPFAHDPTAPAAKVPGTAEGDKEIPAAPILLE